MHTRYFSPFLMLAAMSLVGGCVTLGGDPVTPLRTAEKAAVTVAERLVCAGQPKRSVLVTAFPLRYPEQIKQGEFMGWAQVISDELSRTMARGNRVQAVAAAHRFPFESADKAPELERNKGMALASEWAGQVNAQYVVAGVAHDFGVSQLGGVIPERQMHVEAFIYDARSGTLLARQTFLRQVHFAGLPKAVAPGTREFATTRLGEAFNSLIEEMGRWTEDTLACLPFSVRVTRVEERRLTLDVGGDRGVAVGMALQSWRPGSAPPARPGMPVTARPSPTATIKLVEGKSSVAEISQQRVPPTIRVGDVLYLMDADGRNKL